MEFSERDIDQVLDERTPELLSIPGVVGTARGERDGRPCVHVLVVERKPDLVKKVLAILGEVPAVVIETGEIEATDSLPE